MPIKGLAELNRNLREIEKDLTENQVVLLEKKIALQCLGGFVLRTPVRTGRARGNWQVTINAPATGALEIGEDIKATPLDKRKSEKSSQSGLSSITNQTIQRGSSIIAGIRQPVVIYLTNNVPYIEDLENGSSKQAPNGMVSVTLESVNAQFP